MTTDERQKLIDRLEEAMAHISSVQHCLEGGCYSLADLYATDAWREVRAVRLALEEEGE